MNQERRSNMNVRSILQTRCRTISGKQEITLPLFRMNLHQCKYSLDKIEKQRKESIGKNVMKLAIKKQMENQKNSHIKKADYYKQREIQERRKAHEIEVNLKLFDELFKIQKSC